MNRFAVTATNSYKSLQLIDPGQRSALAWNPYPPNGEGAVTDGFWTAEPWGAQFRGAWLISPQIASVASGTSGTVTLPWPITQSVVPHTALIWLANNTDVSTTWTLTWTLPWGSGTQTLALTDLGTITLAASGTGRIVAVAPIPPISAQATTVAWEIALGATVGAAGSLSAGLMYW